MYIWPILHIMPFIKAYKGFFAFFVKNWYICYEVTKMNEKMKQLIEQVENIMYSGDEYECQEALKDFDVKLTSAALMNDSAQKFFISALKQSVEQYINQRSDYRQEGILERMTDQMSFQIMPSREIKENIDRLLKNKKYKDLSDFIALMSDIELIALKYELGLAKEFENKTQDSLNKDETYFGLYHKKNTTLLKGDIRDVQFRKEIKSISEQQANLQESYKNGEIDKLTFVKQSRILQLQLEMAYLNADQSKLFTLYNALALDNQTQTVVGNKPRYNKEYILSLKYDCDIKGYEVQLKLNEYAFAEGNITLEEYLETEKEIQGEIAKVENYTRNQNSSIKSL